MDTDVNGQILAGNLNFSEAINRTESLLNDGRPRPILGDEVLRRVGLLRAEKLLDLSEISDPRLNVLRASGSFLNYGLVGKNALPDVLESSGSGGGVHGHLEFCDAVPQT
jgi:hypothetical protein